jgi:hypothetical protein
MDFPFSHKVNRKGRGNGSAFRLAQLLQ